MQNVLTREQFISAFNEIMRNHGQNCGEDSHPLWIAEKIDDTRRIYCNWFVCVTPVSTMKADEKPSYWQWVDSTLAGDIACFASDTRENEEWWGFTEENDVLIWLLKWAK